jgi:hypothetical protein
LARQVHFAGAGYLHGEAVLSLMTIAGEQIFLTTTSTTFITPVQLLMEYINSQDIGTGQSPVINFIKPHQRL